jgi:class 3 adenylate cyclase
VDNLGMTDAPGDEAVPPAPDLPPASDAAARLEELRALLSEFNERPRDRARVLQRIHRQFLRRLAVLVLDTCGFSRRVRESGIVHMLALLERLERVIRPSVERAGGRVLRREADNVFAVFDLPDQAIRAARDILEDVRIANEALPAEEEAGVSIGIGFGDLIVVGEDDVWGDEMNLASKLGEDMAKCGEVLLSPAARDGLTDAGQPLEERTYELSGLTLTAYRLTGTEPGSAPTATASPGGNR